MSRSGTSTREYCRTRQSFSEKRKKKRKTKKQENKKKEREKRKKKGETKRNKRERENREKCPESSDMSATVYDVMTTLVFSENTIVDKRPVRSMCGVRTQRSDCVLYCTTELCLSVDKREKDKKQGKNDVSVPCLCNVHNLSRVQNLKNLHSRSTADACLKAVSCHHLSAVIVRSIRNIHVRTTISHIQISGRALGCVIPTSVAHLTNINRQPDHLCVKRFSKSILFVSVTAHSSS